MPQPKCVHCGKGYGMRNDQSETVRWPKDQPRPPYTGNGVVIKEGKPWQSAADPGMLTAQRSVWDGESWYATHHTPFCTLRCALSFARKAYAAGARFSVNKESEPA